MRLNQSTRCTGFVAAVVLSGALGAAEYAPEPLRFDSPAENDRGSMILGNGEIGALAWVSADGTLHTVLQCSDSWNEGGSHVKVGAIDYATGCKVDADFRQELSLAQGAFNVSWVSGGRTVLVHYRVQNDPAQPFVVCDVQGAPTVAAKVINWRLYEGGSRDFSQAELGNRFIESYNVLKEKIAFRVNADVLVENGWYHLNRNETVAMMMGWYDYWQATAELGKPDYLSNRAFGGLTRVDRQGERALFVSAITCLQPVKDGSDWHRQTAKILAEQGWDLSHESAKRSAHEAAWREFWSRSHIIVTPRSDKAGENRKSRFPYNGDIPVSYGVDSRGGTKLDGSLTVDPNSRIHAEGLVFAAKFITKNPNANQRLIDNCTPGGKDGSLVDLLGGKVRLIVGGESYFHPAKVAANQETEVAVTVDAHGAIAMTVNGVTRKFQVGMNVDVASAEACSAVTRAWACQRYLSACAGRGHFPIRFNGSIFTTRENNNPDYRRWGHGYWWQNTRLAYYPMLAAGDGEQLKPLFNLYERVLEFNCRRTKKYLGHDGAYFPECMQPWGDHFVGTYGTSFKWKDRKDKLQDAPWHKYEWVGQLELSLMMLDYYAYTQNAEWFKAHALPSIREYVRYFDSHYKVAADGKYDWQPAQALESCLGCTAPMPEVAGVRCVTDRLLALPDSLLAKGDRKLFIDILARTPPLPTRKDLPGGECYAVAAEPGRSNNVETPELYCAFPFRLCSFEKDNVELGIRAYANRRYKTYKGWNQDELFAAMLGLTEEAQVHLAKRALTNSAEGFRWPAYWGPNFDWRPDQCAGGNIQNIPQLMLMQCEGRKIFLLPAWPKNWNCDFKLHAPFQTTIEGKVVDGKLENLVVTPAARRADIVVASRSAETSNTNASAAAVWQGTADEAKATPRWMINPAQRAVDTNEVVVADVPHNLKLFLLIGQSNMAGRGTLSAEDKKPIPRCLKLNRDGVWVEATSPIHFDRPSAGYGIANAFVSRYLEEHPSDMVGLIPCAVGGSTSVTWSPEEAPNPIGANYRWTLARARVAQKHGKIVGILWHQGESDVGFLMKNAAHKDRYVFRLAALAAALRRELNCPDAPFLVGEIGTLPRNCTAMNPVLAVAAEAIPNGKLVKASDQTGHLPDGIHFDTPSYKVLGARYYTAWKSCFVTRDALYIPD